MTRLLLCYDGSHAARHAVVEVARLFPGARAVMLNVWKPTEAIAGGYQLAAIADDGRAWNARNDATRGDSAELALEATLLAQAHGLVGEPLTEAMGASVWETVIASARELGASLIVTGGRGLSGLRELVSGSLSHRLIQHSEVPVLVVPPPKAP